MFKKLFGLVAVAAIGLFGYYFFTDNTLRTNKEKAKDAGQQVVESFKDAGVEGLVKTSILSAFGYENTRYIHTTNDNGHVVVYGMAPPSVDLARLKAEVQKVAGVTDVEVGVTTLTPQLAVRRGVSAAPGSP